MSYQAIRDNCPFWNDYIDHKFVQKMADGTLSRACFQHYLQQDYLFLIQCVRAWALAVYKSDNLEQMRAGQAGINAMLDGEIHLHLQYCQSWNIPEHQLLQVAESPACVAYTRYVLDVGMTGGLTELFTALAPCIVGYAEIGKAITTKATIVGNPYQSWIDMYSGKEYQVVADEFQTFFNGLCQDMPAKQLKKIQHIFDTATRMEASFWQMGLDIS